MYWRLLQQSLLDGCSFTDEGGAQCGGTPTDVTARKSRGAFDGCSDWKVGDPPTYLGGDMARWAPSGVDLDPLATCLCVSVEVQAETDTCTFTAVKCFRELVCKRHGGEFPSLVPFSGGRCPVRFEVYTPQEKSAGGPLRVLDVMCGTHSHVVQPRSSVVISVVRETSPETIRTLQVCAVLPSASGLLCIFCCGLRPSILHACMTYLMYVCVSFC